MTGASASVKETLAALSPDRAELLQLLLEEESRQSEVIRPYPRSSGTASTRAPTSWAQQRLWFIDQLEGGSRAYHISVALRLRGALDESALLSALDALVQRHETLRTVFVNVAGQPWQAIDSGGRFALEAVDLHNAGEVGVRREHQAEAARSFDLGTGPLIRGRLLRILPDENVLVLTVHHIISDGWSMGVLIRELTQLYAAHRAGQAAALEVLPIQYADYAQWQRQWLRGEAFDQQLSYWLTLLRGAPPQLELPTDRARPAVQSYDGANEPVTLDAPLTAQLKAFARQNDMTLFMVLFAGWAALLSRLSGQADVVIGTPIANRRRPEVEGLIGFFVNTLALRVAVRGDAALSDYLQSVKEVTLGAYRHQDVPFEKVVEALQPERSLSRNPLFQVMFALQNAPKDALTLPELTVSVATDIDEPALFDLLLSLEEKGDAIEGVVNYATDLFDQTTIQRWMACYKVLLRGMATAVQATLSDLPVLPEGERRQIVHAFNATQVDSPDEPLIHELIEEQVRRTPAAIAVRCGSERLTYAELNAQANQLAHCLRSKGVGPDRLVALCVDRNIRMLVGLLGILKAGGAYVPLDPTYPPERLAHILADASPQVLLTQGRFKGVLPETSAAIMALDADWGSISQQPTHDQGGGRSSQLAYVIYTSGSTGRPKGVAIEHRNTANLIRWARSAMSHDVFSCTLGSTSLNFDLSVYECFVPLSVGGTVIVVENALALLGSTADVTLINTVPSAISGLLDAGAIPRTTRVINLAGEVLKQELVERLFRETDVERVCNLYGPSETTTYSTWISMSRDSGFIPSIGRPVDNTQIYILDSQRKLVPIGVVGEIYIAGAGVARGYLNLPELTTERFTQSTFSAGPALRLYKTGDLGRWHPDGTIEYLGRNDHQVKIRGYRIELGEIEAQLTRHAQVKEAAVVVREDTPGEKRVVAYVVGDRNAAAAQAGNGVATGEDPGKEIVSEWETLWKDTYGQEGRTLGPSFVGWNSSYTGQPIPEDQMEEWLAGTVGRIRALQPRKALEIGCGVGLVLQHVAPECSVYVGTDFSAAAIENLRRWTAAREDLKHVDLLARSATELQELPSNSFDTIILNSVVQYFPDVEYLVAVLQEAMRLLEPGGRIFIGDVRHYGLLALFHTATQLSRASSTVTVEQLRKRIARAIEQEKELLLDPRFFETLPERFPRLGAVEIQIKRGRASNELTRYRYDVVLSMGSQSDHELVFEPLELSSTHAFDVELEAAFEQRSKRGVSLRSLPNRRMVEDLAAQQMIEASDAHTEVRSLRSALLKQAGNGLDPEELWTWGERHGYDVLIGWSGLFDGSFDAKLWKRGHIEQLPRRARRHIRAVQAVNAFANDPRDSNFRQQLIPQLRDYLKGQLPEYMIPSAWMTLKALPLTPNGKVDRQALPSPEGRPDELGEYVPPRTDMERRLAEIWAQVLRVDRVGARDNFFELGGHSLLIVQMIDRLRRVGLTTEVRSIYASPTLADLARKLTGDSSTEFVAPPNLIPPLAEVITPAMLPLVDLGSEHIRRIERAVPGGARNIQDLYPLAPLQEGILFHHLLKEGDGDIYVIPMLFSFSSRARLAAFTQALQAVIDRHDILRTAVLWELLPQPVQVVHRQVALPVESVTLDSKRDVMEQLRERMSPGRQRLDLRRAPLMRLQVTAEPFEGAFYGLLQLHHLVCDNQSLTMLLAEVSAHLEERSRGLPEPVPYRNFIAQALGYARSHSAETFFRNKLGDVYEPTAPFGLLNVQGDAGRIEEVREVLEPALARRLRVQARRLGVTPATLFHAAWAVVLSQTTGRNDIVFGTVLLSHLQGSAGQHQTLGMFINTLPLRLRLEGASVKDLVRQTQEELVELLSHEQASLAIAQRCSSVGGQVPLFSTLLNYRHNAVDPSSSLSKAQGIALLAGQSWTNYPIMLSVDDVDERFVLEVDTDRRIDPYRVVEYVSAGMRSLITALEEDPDTSALALTILSATERRRVLETFNNTQVDRSGTDLVHTLFEKQVQQAGGGVAVTYENRSLSYAELNAKANRLARYLKERGVGPDQVVGICVQRSLEMVVGLLAILKAGGAYLPLDPHYPAERLRHMLEDAAPRLILTQQDLLGALPGTNASLIPLDVESAEVELQSDQDLLGGFGVTPANLVYVIYTSGSTGRPKGTAMAHGSMVNLMEWHRENFGSGQGRRVLQFAALSFDVAFQEIFSTLCTGGTLVLLSESTRKDIHALSQLLVRERIDRLFVPPMMLQNLAEYCAVDQTRLPDLRDVITAGEQLRITPQIRDFFHRFASCRLHNHYGPTETHVVTALTLTGNPVEWPGLPSIGRPVSNTAIYILDERRQPVPLGVAGEVFVGGQNVARGYLGRPDLTRERFILDPFGGGPRGRLYRTGDQARWNEDGTLEYLGRNDFQVKIRGYRIELGEIEAQLERHEGLKDAAVVAREDVPGEKRLVAYVTARDKGTVDLEEVRGRLKAVLPEYMVPAAFVVLDRMPVTPSGKLDRRALPAPDLASYVSRAYEPPVGEVEQTLADIWQELLHVERVGRQDNFFELGGHSLHVMKLSVKAAERFNVALSVPAVFQSPTLAGLAAVVTTLQPLEAETGLVEFEEGRL